MLIVGSQALGRTCAKVLGQSGWGGEAGCGIGGTSSSLLSG